MFKLVCVTNRSLCREDFLTRIQQIAQSGVSGIILREKDLSEADYQILAAKVLTICREYGVPCILHSFVKIAIALGAQAIHLPLPLLRTMTQEHKEQFRTIGASCHSLEDVLEAQKLGCSYVTLGHIFATDCKKGMPPRGLNLLRDVCRRASLPVLAIGGIDKDNIGSVKEAGAGGACIMSGLMACKDVNDDLDSLKKAVNQHEI